MAWTFDCSLHLSQMQWRSNKRYVCCECSQWLFKNVETIVAGELLHNYLPIYGFTLKYREEVKHDENGAHFKEHCSVKPSPGKSLAPVLIKKCSSLSSLNFLWQWPFFSMMSRMNSQTLKLEKLWLNSIGLNDVAQSVWLLGLEAWMLETPPRSC